MLLLPMSIISTTILISLFSRFNLQILANDSDSSFNALIVYSLVPDLNYHYLDFVINPINGSITTTKPLDRENISIYYLTVTAENSALNTQTRFVGYEKTQGEGVGLQFHKNAIGIDYPKKHGLWVILI